MDRFGSDPVISRLNIIIILVCVLIVVFGFSSWKFFSETSTPVKNMVNQARSIVDDVSNVVKNRDKIIGQYSQNIKNTIGEKIQYGKNNIVSSAQNAVRATAKNMLENKIDNNSRRLHEYMVQNGML